MTELVFSQNKPPKIKITELLFDKGWVWFIFLYFFIFLDEGFINRWGLTAVLRTALITIAILVLVPSLVILWAKSDRVQNRRPPTLLIESDRIIFHGYRRSQLVKFDAIKRVTVQRKPDGDIASITLHQRPFHMLTCQNFADMPALYAALKERLPASVRWFEPRSSGRWPVGPFQAAIFLVLLSWLFSGALNLGFLSALNLSLILFLGIMTTSQLLQQSRNASRGAKVTLVLGATAILGFFLYGLGDIPQALYHPCGLVHRWQSGCLKAYPDSENLLFLPDGQLARLSGRAIVIEPVDGNSFINLFTATRLINDRYASSLSFSADGRTAVADDNSGVTIWNLSDQSSTFLDKNFLYRSQIISPDGQLLASADRDSGVIVQATATLEPVFIQKTEGFPKIALGQTLVAVGLEEAVYFYEVRSGEETAVFSIDWLEEPNFAHLMIFSDDEQLLALVTNQSILSILQCDGNEWREIHRVQLDPAWQSDDALAFSADNALLAVAQDFYSTSENRGQLLIFSLADMELLRTIDLGRGLGQLGSVRVLDFSPDNTMLAVSSFSEGAVFELGLAK